MPALCLFSVKIFFVIVQRTFVHNYIYTVIIASLVKNTEQMFNKKFEPIL